MKLNINIQQIQRKLPLAIAIACGILAVFLLNVYLRQKEEQVWLRLKQVEQKKAVESAPQMGVVLVAKQDILPQTILTPEEVIIRQVPIAYIQPGAATSLEGVMGQLVSGPILANEQILRTKLNAPGKIGKPLAEVTPKGKRAMTIPVDNISMINGFLEPGDYVDILAIVPANVISLEDAKNASVVSVPFLQGIEVLAIGGQYVTRPANPNAPVKKQGEKGSMGTVTLSLTLQETLLLTYVQERGKIKLVMHSTGDEQTEHAKIVNEEALLRYLHPEEPRIKVEKVSIVEVYRGLNKEVVPLSKGKE